MLSMTKLVPIVSKLGTYLKAGADHYAMLRSQGEEIGPDMLAAFMSEQMNDWKPSVNGVELVDEPTRAAGARFLAGVAIRLAQL